MKTYEGKLVAKDLRFGVVVSRFNESISRKLLDGCIDTLRRHDVNDKDYDVVWVPGAFEMPLAAKKLIDLNKYDAVICLGAIIRGETPHFDYVATETAKGIAALSNETGKPVIFGVLTTDSIEQALERSGAKHGNRGTKAALSAIEMANVLKAVK